jgi:hypothetical protein
VIEDVALPVPGDHNDVELFVTIAIKRAIWA